MDHVFREPVQPGVQDRGIGPGSLPEKWLKRDRVCSGSAIRTPAAGESHLWCVAFVLRLATQWASGRIHML